MKSVGSTGIALLGIFWLITGFSTCASNAVAFLKYSQLGENAEWFADWLAVAGLSAGSVLLLFLLPALSLILFSGRIADRLFQPEAPTSPLSPASIYVLGCTLLSFFFGIQGLASFVGGALSTLSVYLSDTELMRSSLVSSASHSLGFGAMEFAAGVLLYRHAVHQSRKTPASGRAA